MSFTSNEARLRLLARSGNQLDLVGETLKVMLVQSTYTPDRDHQFVDAITGGTSKELSGTGYVAGFAGSGRKTLASKALAKDDSNDLAKLSAADLTWTAINAGTIRYAVVIREGTTDADSLIIAVIDVNATAGYLTDGNDFLLKWPSNGVLKFTAP